MLQYPVCRAVPPFRGHDVRIVTPSEDASIREVFRQEIFVVQPADFPFIRGPCRQRIAIHQTMHSDNTIVGGKRPLKSLFEATE